jgi:Rhamnan synthesis protein F
MMEDVRVAGEDPLVAALRMENSLLLETNKDLARQLSAARAAQAEVAGLMRLTAPLRRIQEMARLRKQERRRRSEPAASPAVGSQALDLTPGSGPQITVGQSPIGRVGHVAPVINDAQAARYPLMARTREWMEGRPISGPDIQPLRRGRSGRVLVIAHVFYPEIWPELAVRIERIPAPYDVVVTLVEGHSAGLVDRIVAQFPNVVIETLPNRGRDIWPMVHVAELGLIGDYDAVLKLHTKRSVHRFDGDAWRERLLDALCPTPEGIGLILELLRRDPEVGMVAPAGAVLGQEFWGGNGPLITALAARSGIPVDPAAVWFPGGSMFWSRPGPLNRLRKAGLTMDDFEHEVVTLDCTTAHALERFFGALVADAGQTVVGTHEVAGRLARARANSAPAALPELQAAGASRVGRTGPAAVA